jgi:prepilin-type N-terminal cleavage/methylation domain-containing protein
MHGFPGCSVNSKRIQGAYAPRSPRGFTLIEMLVAVAVSMIMMLAIAQIFLLLGNNMDKGRALIEMSGQLRNVTHRLQEDLDGLTCSTLPWTKTDAGDGYFEYIEGAGNDAGAVSTMLGDVDDLIAFTARSKGKPFTGRYNGGVAESELAEIIWWVHDDGSGVRTLNRRVLLIRPDLSPGANNDISSSPATSNANSLADLTLRQNRNAHGTSFPHEMNTNLTPAASRETVLSNVVAFDVRAFDPRAPVRTSVTAPSALVPGDPGWAAGTNVGVGAYVDLGYAGNQTTSLYSGAPNSRSQISNLTYSTWPFFYEQDGVDQDGATGADQGTNGFDDNPSVNPAADDPGEYETMPPYPHALTGFKAPGLRGNQVRIRMNEPDSRQVRQATVVAEFLPE